MRTSIAARFALALALASVAAQALADDKDGAYVHKELQIKLAVAPEHYDFRGYEKESKGALQTLWSDILFEFAGKDVQVGGVLVHHTPTFTVERLASWREESLRKQVKGLKRVVEKKLEKKVGSWLSTEIQLQAEANDFHWVQLYIVKGKHAFELHIWCPEALFEDCRAEMYKIVESVEYGEIGATAAGPAPADKPKEGAGEPPAAAAAKATKVPVNAWNGMGRGSFARYKMLSEGPGYKTEMTLTYELLRQDGKSYGLKVVTEMAGGIRQEATQDFEVDPAAGRGGEEPKVERGKETVKVPAGEFECEWTKTTTGQGWSKSWVSDKVPGGLVRSQTEMSGIKSTLELLEQAKK